jgi:hypothetical protein
MFKRRGSEVNRIVLYYIHTPTFCPPFLIRVILTVCSFRPYKIMEQQNYSEAEVTLTEVFPNFFQN